VDLVTVFITGVDAIPSLGAGAGGDSMWLGIS
jgi:hypothetical protein